MNSSDVKYAGLMFDGTDATASTSLSVAQTNEINSNIKDIVDEWYATKLTDSGTVSDPFYIDGAA